MMKADISLFGGLHWVARKSLDRAGYHFELRRSGDLAIGLWRIRTHRDPDAARRRVQKRLVLVPGFGDTPLSWLTVLTLLRPVLNRRYDEVVLLDFPGFHGFLSRHRCAESMDHLLSATSDIFDSLRPHTILGHSLGGWITGSYLAACGSGERPTKGQRHYRGPVLAILASPAGVFGNEEQRTRWKGRFERAIQDGLPALREHLFYREPWLFRIFAREFAGFIQREDTIEFMHSVRDDHEIRSRLKYVRADVWLLWGEEDTLIPAEIARTWVEELPREKVHAIMLPRVGHSLQMERPGVVAVLLGQILLGRAPVRASSRWWHPLAVPVPEVAQTG
jgi:pimeloyl-ACP methyl ester carboxylesterase